ncbi:L-asparaginase [Salmonella enterica subsp. arizonae]|uniref:L-asparaginase n=1 Tax=Salmonella enterica subsp. arizonae TaxID=59203 RepID=A0A379SPN5_SALER|nr:L-asparaginase [Salmonella enterica subsp. arizonae]
MKIRVFMATVLLLISHCVFSTTSLPHIVILATGGYYRRDGSK